MLESNLVYELWSREKVHYIKGIKGGNLTPDKIVEYLTYINLHRGREYYKNLGDEECYYKYEVEHKGGNKYVSQKDIYEKGKKWHTGRKEYFHLSEAKERVIDIIE